MVCPAPSERCGAGSPPWMLFEAAVHPKSFGDVVINRDERELLETDHPHSAMLGLEVFQSRDEYFDVGAPISAVDEGEAHPNRFQLVEGVCRCVLHLCIVKYLQLVE